MSLVWIIDDEPAICWALRKNLEADSHKVQVFSAAEPALKQLGTLSARPDLVLLDVRLPGSMGLMHCKDSYRKCRSCLLSS